MLDIKTALNEIHSEVKSSNNLQDLEYFEFHRKRFERMANTISKELPAKKLKVLEIGSHYLHTSLLLKKMGHDVDSMDVDVFWNLDFVKDRKQKFGIQAIVENNLETMNSIENVENKYDLVLFTEILEHITFNPINFWKRIHGIIKSSGMIYISTPNSLALTSVIRTLKNLIVGKGIGIKLEEIFTKVTYGHHWKEYSSREIKQYFQSMSDDFDVSIRKYHYKHYNGSGFAGFLFRILGEIGNISYIFSEEIEALVKVNKKGGWKMEAPIP